MMKKVGRETPCDNHGESGRIYFKSAHPDIDVEITGRGAELAAQLLTSRLEGRRGSAPAFDSDMVNALKVTLLPGDILALHRTSAGITQTELSESTGISVSAISMMEHSRRPIKPGTAERLAAALNCPANDFL